MRALRLLLSFGTLVLMSSVVSASTEMGNRQNLTNIRERLPQMVAEFGAMTYEEGSDETSRPAEDGVATLVTRQVKRESAEEDNVEYQNYQGVMGRPGVDFPVLPSIPRTGFTCKKVKNSGYYADLDTDCQVFHICDQGRKISFLCPNGTIFRQSHLICDWWWTVDCESSLEHYESSSEQLARDQKIYKQISDQKNADRQSRGKQQRRISTETADKKDEVVSQSESQNVLSSTFRPPTTTTVLPVRKDPSQNENTQKNNTPNPIFQGRQGKKLNREQNPESIQQYQQQQQKQELQHKQQQYQEQQVLQQQRQQQQRQKPKQQSQQQQPQQQQQQQQQQSTTPVSRGSAKNYNNFRVNYGTSGGENEQQIPAESASFVSNKNQFAGVRQNQFLQPPFEDSPSTTRSSNPEPSSKSYVELERLKTEAESTSTTGKPQVNRGPQTNMRSPSSNQASVANLPSFRIQVKPVDEDVFSNPGRGPPTKEFYKSTTTEVIPITDVVSPSGNPFTAEDVTRQQNNNGPRDFSKDYVQLDRSKTTSEDATTTDRAQSSTLAVALSRKVKPVYIQVTTKEGRLATSTTPQPITDVLSPSGKPFTDEEALEKALGTLGPRLHIKYETTTEYAPITDVVQPAGVPFRDEDFANYKPFVPPEPPKPSVSELPPIAETVQPINIMPELSLTELPPITDVVKPNGLPFNDEDEIRQRIQSEDGDLSESKTNLPPISDVVKQGGALFTSEDKYVVTHGPDDSEAEQKRTELPPIFDIVRPTGTPFTSEDNFIVTRNHGLESASLVTESPPQVASRSSTTFVEFDRLSKELKFVTTASPKVVSADVNERASELHSALDRIVHGKALNAMLRETLITSPDEHRRKPFADVRPTPTTPKPSTTSPFSSRGVPRRFQTQTPISYRISTTPSTLPISSSTPQATYESIPTTLLTTGTDDNVITDATLDNALKIEHSNRDQITVQPGSLNTVEDEVSRTNGDRTGLQIPTSSGPAVLHSLAVYFGDKSVLNATEPTLPADEDELLQRAYSNNPLPSLGIQSITEDESGAAPQLLTQFTKDSYEALFPETRKVSQESNNATEELIQAQDSSSIGSGGNSLIDKTAEAMRKAIEIADLRELAQVFSRALSAYLEDPEEFRKVLSEIRPTPPPETTTRYSDLNKSSSTTTQFTDREEDEVLEYSDDLKVHKRPTIKVYSKPVQEQKKPVSEPKLAVDRKGRILTISSVEVGSTNEETTTTQFQSSEIGDPTRLPFESLDNAQSSYYTQPRVVNNNIQIASELPNDFVVNEALTDYNLPPGSEQYKGPGYGPQPGDAIPANTEQPLETTTETSTYAEITSTVHPCQTTTISQEGFEGTTVVPNQYDGSIIPVLNTDLTPPIEANVVEDLASNDEGELSVFFQPQDLNNLADITSTGSEPTTTEEMPTTTERADDIVLAEDVTTGSLPVVTTTTTAVPHTIRFNVKEDRQGRRISFSRGSEHGETLISANTASFTSSRFGKENVNQWNAINRFESLRDVKNTQEATSEPSSTTQPRFTSRPAVRRRFKTTTTEVTDEPQHEEEIVTTSIPFISETEVTTSKPSTTSPTGIIERRLKATTTTTAPVTTSKVVEQTPETKPPTVVPSFQRKSKHNVTKSDKIVYGTKMNANTRRKSTTQESEPTTESAPSKTTVPATYLPDSSTTQKPVEKMPMEMEAKMMFGNLNESTINHLMDVMKMAESNSTVRRLVLLLVNHGSSNKTTEETRRNLIEALLTTTPDEIPAPSALQAEEVSPLQQLNETTSMKVSMTVGTSSKTSSRKGKMLIGSSVRMSTNEGSVLISNKEPTTTQVPITTYRNNGKRVVYKATVPTTTKRPSERKKTTPTATATTTSTTMKVSVSSGNSTVATKKASAKRLVGVGEPQGSTGTLIQESDSRAVDLLRSLYSLAARWG